MRKLIVALLALVLLLSLGPGVALAEKPDNPKPLNPKVLEAVFIHYEHPGKPTPKPTPTPGPTDNTYYLLLGPKWGTLPVTFYINPTNSGLDPSQVFEQVRLAFSAWDDATSASLFATPIRDDNSWWGREDGRNNVSWQRIAGPSNIIAGTWIWYYDNDDSGTMTSGDTMKETDIVFNLNKTIPWGIDLNPDDSIKINAYDVRNIATHEAGHVVGLDDLYDDLYRDITMYGYSSKGETKKISLETGDINGTIALYGS